ncbi:hypothetical protein [Parasphingorhabdus cellanae]|uniref:OmpA-like domain-containing protein n=1 Tax=Parasphingorhabdus cellanae TaxID=2806553 RepID=A0ABX7T8F1_9SPHN|nr:hypothetical protein [Parasphingorhabdus cellanae]QTD56490.1 hypothetical protein J4G78_02520 [Parasphingorhabdus cellanae]
MKRANRWSLAFADLSLLMLGFVVLSFVRPENFADVAEIKAPSKKFEWPTASLYESSEAMLTATGKEKAKAVAGSANERASRVILSITGSAAGSARLDAWELSAARMASFARALKAEGVEESAIIFGERGQSDDDTPQQLIVSIQHNHSNIAAADGTGLASR